ncbi:hypothetical protein KXJ72_10530 [Comamonas aquatica]|nr:hypothetical protein KXJ72_10530 [Comamonas aquatica]
MILCSTCGGVLRGAKHPCTGLAFAVALPQSARVHAIRVREVQAGKVTADCTSRKADVLGVRCT